VKALLCLLGALIAAALPAQDPAELKRIVEKVDEELQAIDKLLQQSAKKVGEEKPKDLLQQTNDRSKAVESGIDELIKKLEAMRKQGQGQSQSDDQPKPQQDDKPGQQPKPGKNRRDNQNPDFVQQPQQSPQPGGEQPKPQGQQPQGQQPQGTNPQDGPEKSPDAGQNKPGNRQPEPNLGPGQRGAGDDSWGELQPYVNFLKNRGSPPKVPDKFRKYWEAYLKQKPDGSPGSGGK
jgi:hypothetical protein